MASYASMNCDAGRGLERRVTIEVALSNRCIVQARGRYNAPADPVEQRILRPWAVAVGLNIASWVRL